MGTRIHQSSEESYVGQNLTILRLATTWGQLVWSLASTTDSRVDALLHPVERGYGQVAISRNGAERNGTELRSKIRNGTGLTERIFVSCNCSEKGSRPLDYVHDVILERKTSLQLLYHYKSIVYAEKR